MKKLLGIGLAALALFFLLYYLHFNLARFLPEDGGLSADFTVVGREIFRQTEKGPEPFEIRGVDMGAGYPGYFATEYAISKETYLRWFGLIQDMGANTLRVYTILADEFYEAFYEYNQGRKEPLYLIHGLWLDDYIHNSHRDAYDKKFMGALMEDSRTLVDILHGKMRLYLGENLGSGSYRYDVSPWVLGYIVGVEWEGITVAYTDDLQAEQRGYQGDYLATSPEATAFESMLARVGDDLLRYESQKYGVQKLLAFSNWPTTDPLDYPQEIAEYFDKTVKVDAEHILPTPRLISGCFASYHIYPYYPDYLRYEAGQAAMLDPGGRNNTYYTYLKRLVEHHTLPVVISEFGVPTSRGMAARDFYTGRNQGNMSEADQARALVECYEDIRDAGCAGCVIFTWQDEWFKRTWNTMHAVDLLKTPYWSDAQTNEQAFGLLSFDPGWKQSVCYIDGDLSEWQEEDLLFQTETSSLSIKYDERYLYFLAWQEGFAETQTLYLAMDLTPSSGSLSCTNYNLHFDRPCDFVVAFQGHTDSRVVVQERYEVLRAMFGQDAFGIDPYEDPPATDSPVFKPIHLILQTAVRLLAAPEDPGPHLSETYETGLLRYGNGNPQASDYDSLADFIFAGDYVELRLPWQLLNFANPSEMQIHDDYYLHYGVEYRKIREAWFGLGDGSERIRLFSLPLKGWGQNVTFHERLKAGYYAMQSLWAGEAGGGS